MKHLAATPAGMTVRATATVTEVDGRRIRFSVEAHDEKEKIAEGDHERFIVNMAKFLDRVAQKVKSYERPNCRDPRHHGPLPSGPQWRGCPERL